MEVGWMVAVGEKGLQTVVSGTIARDRVTDMGVLSVSIHLNCLKHLRHPVELSDLNGFGSSIWQSGNSRVVSYLGISY